MQGKDVLTALQMILMPWVWYGKRAISQLEQWFRSYFSVSYAISFASGRAALLAMLKSLSITKGDEVIVQAFTCMVVPNAIHATGATPVYVDITDALTIVPEDLEKKITSRTKAIIVQHTFGMAAAMKEIMAIANKHKIPVLEDCAHVLGETYGKNKLGTIGLGGFFSLGRDKPFSSVFGGVAITDDKTFGKNLRVLQKNLSQPPFYWTLQQLFHPIAFFFILAVYNVSFIGKAILYILQKLRLLSFPVMQKEKEGHFQYALYKKMPNSLACLAISQLKRVEHYNKRRKALTVLYQKLLDDTVTTIVYKKEAALLRFPILMPHANDVVSYMRKKGIYLGRWYSNIIDPIGSNVHVSGYRIGSCPNAERLAHTIVNLPTYPLMSDKDVKKVVHYLQDYARSQGNNT